MKQCHSFSLQNKISDPSLPGYTVFDYSWPGSAWPECECRPRLEAGGCRMEGAEGEAEYNMRYVYTVGGGDLPGIDIKVPLPASVKIIAWRVKIAWDLKTVDRRIQVTSRSKVRIYTLDCLKSFHSLIIGDSNGAS